MIWDRDNLNAPHTEREIAMIEDIGASDMPVQCDGAALLDEAMTEHFGARCDEYQAGCACCDVWAYRDALQAAYGQRASNISEIYNAPFRLALDAIAAEKAEWPHAGSMHDGARHACDAIAARIREMMGA